ncbi:cupin domain-containing protein [Leifsonia sp. H3M29-4]|uniref:cupin domain-containing protein n=1 Tax=Salinibacterium metalliresistens TaxID=3031321 RepID=UPI0023DC88FE|nr:cupin domain-containing protein [Salinibacterium metalliresistens]MDF1480375.1 cupin domain-containing protein [Salinibacterium metalliresistens]
MRRVVTGLSGSRAVIVSDRVVAPLSFGTHGGSIVPVWPSTEGGPNGFRVSILNIPPSDDGEWDAFVMDRFGDDADSAQPGMHETPTTDVCFVVSGAVALQLDGGDEVILQAGDVVLQDRTRHRWVNRGAEMASIMAVLVEASATVEEGRPTS